MSFPSLGRFGPEALLDALGNALVDVTVAVPEGYTATVDAVGNLTVVGPPVDLLPVTVTPQGRAPFETTLSVLPSVADLVDTRFRSEATTKVGQRLIELLDKNIRDCSIVASTDSVGAENRTNNPPDPHEWVYMLGERLAAAYPGHTVLFHPFDQNAYVYRTPDVIQTGAAHATPSLTFTSGSAVVTINGSTGSGFGARWVDRGITATALPAGTTVVAVSGNGLSLTVSQAATSSGTETATIGPRTLNVWGAGVAGGYVQIQQAKLLELFGGTNADLIFVAQGHNFGFGENGKRHTLTQFTETLTQLLPEAEMVLIAQNVKTTAPDEILYPPVMRGIAARRGYGFINMRAVFEAADPDNTLLLLDTAHPNTAGHELWADEVADRMLPYDPLSIPRGQQPSSLSDPVDNLLANGDFSQFTTATPASWTAGNATLSKDTTNFEGTQGYALRGVPAAAGASSFVEQVLTSAAVTALRGQWITLAARVFVPSTPGDSQAGLLQIRDTNASDTVTVSSNPTDEGFDAFRWTMVSHRVRTDCTSLRLFGYFDFGTDGGGDATFDRLVLAPGLLPRDMRRLSFGLPRRLLSDTFDLATAGVKTVLIPHGLGFIPPVQDVMLALTSLTSPSAAIGYVALNGTDETNIDVRVRVTTAGGAGSTGKVVAHVVVP